MVEFALIAPLFFMLIFGVVEYSLINASIGTFNFAAKDAARQGAITGNAAVQINSTTTMPIDQYMVYNIILPRVTGVVFAQITEVDIFDAAEDGTCVIDSATGTCKADVWTLSKGVWTSTDNWPASTRNDALSNADYLGVKIYYTYTYLTAFFAVTSPTINLTAESVQRIEPQQFGDRFNPGGHAWAAVNPQWSPFAAMSAPFATGALWTRDNQGYLMTTGGRA